MVNARIFCAFSRIASLVLALSFNLTACPSSAAQSPGAGSSTAAGSVATLRPAAQSDRIAVAANLGAQLQLTGHIPSWATPDHQTTTPVDLSQPIHLSLVLRRDPTVEAALDQLLADQQNPASTIYHQWLTPQQIGTLFGPTQSDLDAITSWATVQGFAVESVQPNRMIVKLTGTLASAANAFHTTFAYYNIGEKPRLSAIVEPSIPAAFGAVVQSIRGLTETHLHPTSRSSLHMLPASGVAPQDTFSATEHFMLPDDFAVIYDVASVYSGGNTGATIGAAAQHIAIIGESRVVATDISNYETLAGLAASQPTVVLAGADPGTSNSSAAGEATLDVDRVIGTAPGAQVDLVISANSGNEDGVDLAMTYNINTLRDPIMTVSFGSCEAEDGQSADNFYNSEFQTAAAGGMSIFISSDDSGAAGCDDSFTAAPASQALSINTLCSSAYVTCVGGTEFNDTANPSLYWSPNNGTGGESALGYIPEGAWNEPNNSSTGNGFWIAATGGGTSVYIPRPSWQTSSAFPSGAFRLVPDVSFSSSDHNGYVACFAAGQGSCVATSKGTPVIIFSGTSAAAPSMAGIAALINTKLGSAQGNMNPLLYGLDTSSPSAFHDATVASSGVTGCSTATPSMCNNSTPAPNSLTGGLAGYALLAGYDEATGLGSLDVAKFLAASGAMTVATSLAVTASPNPAIANQTVTLTANLTPGASSSTPTGAVQFYSNGVAIGSPATLTTNVATLSYIFTTPGTYSITAVYSGDGNFTTATATAVSLIVNSPAFTITPAKTTYTLISGAASGNTDAITITSTSTFAGTLQLHCSLTSASGTAAGSCTILPNAATLTAGSTATSTLTITTTTGTSGVLQVVVSGTSGNTTITSPAITVNLTASSFTLTASPAALPTSGTLISGGTVTSVVTVASANGFVGNVALTCAAANLSGVGTAAGSCTVSPASVALTSGGTVNTTVTITTTAGTSGVLTATISGTGTTANSAIATTASTNVAVTLTVPSFTLTPMPTALAFTSGATTGNTDTITVTSVNGFAGPVALNCSISTSAAAFQPSCMATPSSITLAAGGTATSVISITSMIAQAAVTQPPQLDRRWTMGSGAFFAMLLVLPAFRRRRHLRLLAALGVMVFGFAALSGCGSSATPSSTFQSSAGSYTVTVTGTGTNAGSSTSTTATTSFSLTIN